MPTPTQLPPTGYDHRQWTWYAPLLGVVATALLATAPFVEHDGTGGTIVLLVVGGTLAAFALSMAWLRVHDAGDRLVVRFGPLPLFRKELPYREMSAAEPSRSHWLEGWGIRWNPGIGWLWNASGLLCVRIERTGRRRPFRIGTDEPDRLARFLRSRLA